MPRANWVSYEILKAVEVGERFTSDEFYSRFDSRLVAAAVHRLKNRGHIIAVGEHNYHAKIWERIW